MTEEIDLRDIVKIIWKRLWLIILFVIISKIVVPVTTRNTSTLLEYCRITQ